LNTTVLLNAETGHGKKRKAEEIDSQAVDVPAKIQGLVLVTKYVYIHWLER